MTGFLLVWRWIGACLVAAVLLAAPDHARAQETAGEAGADAAGEAGDSQLRALAEILRDEAAREALLAEIDRLTAAPAEGDPASGPAAEPEPEKSFGRVIAEYTSATAERVADAASTFWNALARAPDMFSAFGSDEIGVLGDALVDLALIIAATVGVFLVMRLFARRLFNAIGSAAEGAGVLRHWALIVAAVLIDAAVVLLAWAAGYVLVLTVFGETGEMGLRQTLYLNAFLIVEMVKVAVRAVVAPGTGRLRPLPLPDGGARSLYRWLNVAISLIGYGQLLIVPLVNEGVSRFAGRGVSSLIVLIAILILMAVVVARRRAVGAWLLGERNLDARGGLIRFLARNWHVPVLIYGVVLAAIVISRPGGVLFPVLIASGKVLAAVLAGTAIAAGLRRASARGVHLPGGVTERLPLLETRLNAVVPRALSVMGWVIVAAVVAFTVHVIGLADLEAWLESQVGVELTGMLISVALILLASFVVWIAFSSWVDYRLNPAVGRPASSREETLLSLLRNAATVALIVVTLMFVLSEVGVDIAPLLASAGVLGLAIGFGAQKMVQDIITGVFIQLENAINVGDVITVGGTTGTVERLTIRSVSLRDLHGAYHIIPFSSVDTVSNYMRDYGHFVLDMGIGYNESVEEAGEALQAAFDELRANPDWDGAILADLQWFGLQSFGDSAVVVRARIKCAPGQQWAVGRAYNAIVKRIFDERGIEIPFPHQTIYFGKDKEGEAPPVHVAMDRAPQEG